MVLPTSQRGEQADAPEPGHGARKWNVCADSTIARAHEFRPPPAIRAHFAPREIPLLFGGAHNGVRRSFEAILIEDTDAALATPTRRGDGRFVSTYARQRTETAWGQQHDLAVSLPVCRSPLPPPPITVATVMLSGITGFSALMLWMSFVIGASDRVLAAVPPESPTRVTASAATALTPGKLRRRKPKCRECASIELVRDTQRRGEVVSLLATDAPAQSASREITVRLTDGSSRVIVDANPAKWRIGNRVIVIGGLVGPGM